MREIKLAKNLRNILMICFVAMMLVACSDNTQSFVQRSEALEIGKDLVKKEHTEEEQIVEEWLLRVNTEPDYTRDFDKNTVNEEEAALYIRLFNGYTHKVLDRDEDKILTGLADPDGLIRFVVVFEAQADSVKLSQSDEISAWYEEISCDTCKGYSRVVVGTHTENRQQGCGGCGGAGFTYTQFYDGAMWQQQQIACGICAGTGWQIGPCIVNDYEDCENCNGLGVRKGE